MVRDRGRDRLKGDFLEERSPNAPVYLGEEDPRTYESAVVRINEVADRSGFDPRLEVSVRGIDNGPVDPSWVVSGDVRASVYLQQALTANQFERSGCPRTKTSSGVDAALHAYDGDTGRMLLETGGGQAAQLTYLAFDSTGACDTPLDRDTHGVTEPGHDEAVGTYTTEFHGYPGDVKELQDMIACDRQAADEALFRRGIVLEYELEAPSPTRRVDTDQRPE